jgi:hypothetical protein
MHVLVVQNRPRVAAVKSAVLALAASLFAAAAHAQAGPSTLAMSCAQAAGLVTSRGAVVLRTGPHTYDRYVSERNFCEINEFLLPAWIPTLDMPQCFVGYRCKTGPRDLSGQ